MDGIHYVGTMEFVKKDDLDKATVGVKSTKEKTETKENRNGNQRTKI